jgi:cytochrome c peroxidase
MRNIVVSFIVCSTTLLGVAFMSAESTAQAQGGSAPAQAGALFQPSTQCMTCHNGVMTPGGEDVSFGTLWRASMMAHPTRSAGEGRAPRGHGSSRAQA